MGIMPNFRQLMQKADLSSSYLQSNGGYLAPIQDTTFIRMLTEEPTLLRLARTVTMNGPIREFSLVGFGGRILRPHPGSGNKLADSDRTRPDTLRTTLTSKPFLGQVNLPYDMLEDNIERGNFEDTIIALITPQV